MKLKSLVLHLLGCFLTFFVKNCSLRVYNQQQSIVDGDEGTLMSSGHTIPILKGMQLPMWPHMKSQEKLKMELRSSLLHFLGFSVWSLWEQLYTFIVVYVCIVVQSAPRNSLKFFHRYHRKHRCFVVDCTHVESSF